MTPESWMKFALSLAQTAASMDEVPIGAIVVKNQKVIGTGFNLKEHKQISTAHAEMIAIRQACQNLKNWRLVDCQLYVTLEPCLMCAGTIYQSRIEKVYFGASDPKGGALGSLYQINQDSRLNHRFLVEGGILEADCSQILTSFFQTKRNKPN